MGAGLLFPGVYLNTFGCMFIFFCKKTSHRAGKTFCERIAVFLKQRKILLTNGKETVNLQIENKINRS